MPKISDFSILSHNQVQAYMSLGSTNGVHFWWCMSIPLVRDTYKARGCFCHQKHKAKARKHRSRIVMMRKRIVEHRQNWLEQGGET